MALEAAFDNDILIKLSAYGLLTETIKAVGDSSTVGILGAARFLVPKAIERDRRLHDRTVARTTWEAALPYLTVLEPAATEIEFATRIEDLAQASNLAMDGGESQLCAMALQRGVPLIVTGDKRAIAASEVLATFVPEMNALEGRLVCLEQIMASAIERRGPESIRARVCVEPGVDTALTICLGCAVLEAGRPVDPRGIRSYVANVRESAPTMLRPGEIWP